MSKRNILVLGDSHTHAIKTALAGYKTNPDYSIKVYWILKDKGNAIRGDLAYEEALVKISELGENDILALSYLGTVHNVMGLVKNPVPYDVMMPGDEGAAPLAGAEIIPYRTLIRFFSEYALSNKKFLALRKQARCRVLHMSSPPPKKSEKFILAHLKKYRGHKLSEVGVTPAPIRKRLWDVEYRALETVLRDMSVELVPPPPETLSATGFLSEDYYEQDATHANMKYGSCVLQQLESIATSSCRKRQAV
ncbi:hypothetical protein [uncultured Roseibium sp.]|uniref:hypothetical protein n=1 Tax=uncultured Roseibium sp. TaxID=1936171 RepID=UPI002597735C|nr:hypothetical protein [uncultured Roseibium sp.]